MIQDWDISLILFVNSFGIIMLKNLKTKLSSLVAVYYEQLQESLYHLIYLVTVNASV